MIEINIIKTCLEQFKRKRMLFNIFLIYLAGIFLLLFTFSINILINKTTIARIKNEIKMIESKITEEEDRFNYIKVQGKELQHLLRGISIFTKEDRKRVLWEPVLAFTGENVPTGIWLERFAVMEVSDKDKGKLTVVISGYVLPGMVNERAAIDKFVRNMNNGNIFTDVFLKEVKKAVRDKREVITFQLECVLKQKRGSDNVGKTA